MEGMDVSAQDGFAWLKASFDEAIKTQKRTTGAHHSAVYRIAVPHDVELEFILYGTERVVYPGSGRVAGSKRVRTGNETLSLPAGTDVRVYGDPSRISPGSSVATFYLGKEQVTYKRDRNLVHKTP